MKSYKNLKIVQFFLSLSKKQKIIYSSLFLLFVLSIFSTVVLFSLPKKTSSYLYFENQDYAEKVLYVNKTQKRGNVLPGKSAYFKFSENQISSLEKFYSEYENFTVAARIGIKNPGKNLSSVILKENILNFAFLFPDDFDSSGKVKKSVEKIYASVNLSDFLKNGVFYFDLGLSSEKRLQNKDVPCGIEIISDLSVTVFDFLVTKSRIGFDFTDSIPFFGSPSNGGKINVLGSDFDFSGGTLTFSPQWTKEFSMPYYEISFSKLSSYGTSENPVKIKLNAGGEILTIYRTPSVSACVIYSSMLNNPFSFFNLSQTENQITKLLLKPSEKSLSDENSFIPIKTDPGMILKTKADNWRNSEYELYEWDRFPHILFFDTKNFSVQSDFFTRLAFFAEKKGFIGKILTDSQLEGRYGYNAHDYSAKTLAEFFTKAEPMGVLNKKELLLKNILLKNGVIVQNGLSYLPGDGAVISFSKESPNYNRVTFLSHESWHALYFINEDFRNTVSAVYYTIDSQSRDFITEYWQSQPSLNYEPSDIYLMNNEFMAYIMQQPLSSVSKYFVHLASRGSVMKALPELCDYVKETQGITFEDAARIFDSYAFDSFGLACGRVHLIFR